MNEANIIVPTEGRVVHYHIAGIAPPGFATHTSNQYAAHVASVHNPRLVNLMVIDADGQPWPTQSVPLRQPNDEPPLGNYCEWMAYQKGQAARAEQLERRLAGHQAMPPTGEPPTLNTPVRDPQKLAEAIEMSVAARNAPDAPPLESRPDKERAALERNTNDIRRIQDAVRHPVIAAAQELDNNGAVINGTTSTETTDNGERRFAALDQVVESVKEHNANVPPEVIEREIDEAVTAVRAGHPVDDPGTGPFDSPAPPVSITDNLPSFSGSLHGMAKQSHNFDGITDDGGNSLPHIPQD